MKILVTGGAGFIGAHYVKYALAQGEEVTVLDNFSNSSGRELLEKLARSSLQVVHGDILDKALVSKLVGECDLIVNFAAWTHNDTAILEPQKFIESNVLGTAILLEQARKFSTRFHQVSTDEVYGDMSVGADLEFDENSRIRPSNPYSSSKAGADHLVNAWNRTFGLKTSISITCNNFGKYQNVEKFIPKQITRVLQGQPPIIYGDGTNVREWIPVDTNVAHIHSVATSNFFGSTFNIGSGQRFSNLEVVSRICEIMGIAFSMVEFVPDRPGHDQKYAIDSSKFESTFQVQRNNFNFSEELTKLVRWYRENLGSCS